MSYTPVFDPAALSEYEKAVARYKERSETAAQNLAAEVNERIKEICLNPLRYRNTYKHFRKVSLKKFPYYIVYFADKDSHAVIISSLYHHKRNAKKKYRNI